MKTDVRTRYTKKVIKDAFLSLLQEKSLSNVTVKEICEKAEINRSTFYKYYQDCYDLMEQIEYESLRETENLIQNIQKQGIKPVLFTMLEALRQNEELFHVLVSQENSAHFVQKVIQSCFSLFHQDWSHQEKDTELLDMEFTFLAGGAGALIAYWMRNGMKQPPEQIADAINTLCHNAIKTENLSRFE